MEVANLPKEKTCEVRSVPPFFLRVSAKTTSWVGGWILSFQFTTRTWYMWSCPNKKKELSGLILAENNLVHSQQPFFSTAIGTFEVQRFVLLEKIRWSANSPRRHPPPRASRRNGFLPGLRGLHAGVKKMVNEMTHLKLKKQQTKHRCHRWHLCLLSSCFDLKLFQ